MISFHIQGRIIYKGDLDYKSIRNRTKEFFFIVMTDRNNTNIKINFWENEVNKWYQKLSKGEIYSAHSLKVYQPSKNYAPYLKIELNCTKATKFIQMQEKNKNNNDNTAYYIPQNWNFIDNISSIQKKSYNSLIDVIGLVSDIEETKEVEIGKIQKKLTKVRNFQLWDETGKINVSLWGIDTKLKIKNHQIIAISRALVGSYGGKSLTVRGFIELKPRDPKVDEILKFKNSNSSTLKLLSNQVKKLTDDALKTSNRDYTSAPMISIMSMKEILKRFYFTESIPTENVFKVKAKIHKFVKDLYYYKNEEPQWCLSMKIKSVGDDNDKNQKDIGDQKDDNDENTVDDDNDENTVQVIAFGKIAQQIMQQTAKEAAILQHENYPKFATLIKEIENSNKKYTFGIYCKSSEFKDQINLDFVIEIIE